MPYTQQITTVLKAPEGSVTIADYSIEVEDSSGKRVNIDVGAVNKEINEIGIFMAAVPEKTKVFAFAAKKIAGQAAAATTVELTIKTNDAAAPDDTIVITDASGYDWNNGDPAVNPLTADIATVFVSNTGNAAAELIIIRGNDPTP